MIKLSRLTDYAVALLAQIAREDKRIWAAPDLAEATGLPAPTVSKVLKKLTKSGIVTAQRGATGGYRLARPSSETSIISIVEAMDGPIAITDCADGGKHSCSVERICPMQSHWNIVNRAIRQALQDITLAEMAVPPAAFAEPQSPRALHTR